MLRVYKGDGAETGEKKDKRRGQRLAWVKRKGGDEEPLKTIYIKGADFVEDDDEEEDDEGEEPAEENTPYRDDLLPVSFYTGLRNISPYNKDLLRRAIRAKNAQLLQAAKPARQEPYLANYYQRADEEIALQEAKHFILQRPPVPGAMHKHKHKRQRTVREDAPAEAGPAEESGTVLIHPSHDEEGDESGSEVEVDALEVICPIPIKAPFQLCIYGPTGVGKSYWASYNSMAAYERFYPSNPIFVWSFFQDGDPAFDKRRNVQYVKIDDSLLHDPPQTEEFENSLMVFDDIESLNGDLREVVTKFRDQCLACGRKQNISVIAIAHEIFGGMTSRSSILECEQIVLFNQGVVEPIEKLMRKKYGMPKDVVNFVLNSKTRWVMIKRSFPQAIITPREIKCL